MQTLQLSSYHALSAADCRACGPGHTYYLLTLFWRLIDLIQGWRFFHLAWSLERLFSAYEQILLSPDERCSSYCCLLACIALEFSATARC